MSIYKLFAFFLFIALACQPQAQRTTEKTKQKFHAVEIPESIQKIEKSDDEWQKELSEFEYHVLRDKGTEKAFSGEFWDNKKKGTYLCAACGLPLFSSQTKYKSGTGWPSFYKPFRKDFIAEDVDFDIGYKRTEVMCARCGGHLGHVFPDGPKPTGLRYCLNSISLDFVEEKEN